MKKHISALLILVFIISAALNGCGKNESSGTSAGNTSAGTGVDQAQTGSADISEASGEQETSIRFSDNSPFHKKAFDLTVILPEGKTGDIFYTTNGSEPTRDSKPYKGSISIESRPKAYGFPQGTSVSAKAFYSDGTESETIVNTYFVDKDCESFFANYIFLITGNPDDITEKTGILSDAQTIVPGTKNYDVHGKIAERKIHLEVLTDSGEEIVDQFCGLRVHGAYNRRNEVKSLKIIADKEYDENHGSFKYDFFGASDTNGEPIEKYEKLVLRSYGNDFGQAYIRDELNQRLVKDLGFQLYEEVTPAYVYINGNFYNYTWLHENYSNKYFTNKFINENAQGKFKIVEGGDAKKTADEDDKDRVYTDEFNALYDEYAYSPLTDERLGELNGKLDVYGYLEYFAFNNYINNFDWPHNNFKAAKYYKADEEAVGEGIYDGRWYFLFHDMDYGQGQYWQGRTQADHNSLLWMMTDSDVMETVDWWGQKSEVSTDTNRYSPLFTNMMKREDLRNYFIKKTLEYGRTVCSRDYVKGTLKELRKESPSMAAYANYLQKKYKRDNFYTGSEDLIVNFSADRYDWMIKHLAEAFHMTTAEITALAQ